MPDIPIYMDEQRFRHSLPRTGRSLPQDDNEADVPGESG